MAESSIRGNKQEEIGSFRRQISSKAWDFMSGRSQVAEGAPIPEPDSTAGWFVVAGSFLAHFVALGTLYSVGIFIVPLSQEFQAERAEVALVGTLATACFHIGGIFAGPLSDRWGIRPVLLMGVVCWSLGIFLASLSTSVWMSILLQGVLAGIGISLMYWPAIVPVPQWFEKHRATAVGFAVLGSGIGNLVMALAGQYAIDALGWRNALLVIGGVGLIAMLPAVLLLRRRLPPVAKGGLFQTTRLLLKTWNYRVFAVCAFLFQWGFFIPFVHLAAYANDKGYSSEIQGLSIAMLGVGSAIGRVLIGPIADRFGRILIFRVCLFLTALMLFVWPWMGLVPEGVLCFGFFFGFFAGAFIANVSVVAAELFGVATLGGAFAFLNVMMIPGALAASPLAGYVFDTYGTLDPAIWGGAVFCFLSGVFSLLLRKPTQDEQNATWLAAGGGPEGTMGEDSQEGNNDVEKQADQKVVDEPASSSQSQPSAETNQDRLSRV